MKRILFKRLGAVLLAGAMLFGTLPGLLAPIPVAAAEEAATQADGFSAAFSDSYAKVGQPMTVEVQNAASDAITYSWTVDGVSVGSDATYTPTADDLMKWISVTVTCGSDTVTLEMFFSNLPVVYINTENNAEIVSKEEYINAELTIQGNETYNSDTTTLYSGATEIRGRGNSTWVQPKKPYRLKLDKKTDVFGMGKSKHWVLLANYMDESLLRNTLAYDLSGAMGMEHCSTVFVDVILNGDFIGNYQFCENIRVDDTRVNIFDWEGFAEDSAAVIADAEGFDSGDLETYMAENMGWITSGSVTFNGTTYTITDYPDIEIPSINGGYLLELDEYYDEVSKFRTNNNQPIMFKNPEFVNTNSDMMNYVQTYVQAFEDAVGSDSYTAAYDGGTVHYSELYDFDALVDYWLINEIFFNEEINKKSTYMYKDIDGLMYMGPIWDMDWSSGGEGETYQTEQWATVYYSTNAQANNWYKYLIQDPYFFIKAQERYWEIRDAQVADMMAQIDSSYDILKESAAANGERWGYSSDYKTYVDSLRSWFTNHLTWLDTQMATQDTLRDSLGYYASSRLALSLTNTNGNALAADSAKNAPADGVSEAGQALKLTITGGDNTTGNAVLYVNGRRTSVTAINANSTITVDVPADSLTAQAGEKNVLEVQIEAADGSINASRYVTVAATAHEHIYEAVVTAPSCTAGGYTTYTCSCGDSYVGDETEALGHSYENGACTVCGEAEPAANVAVNTTTQTVYATLDEALNTAAAGETVQLLSDVTEANVMVYPDITLDLNGHVLTADYVAGFNRAHIVDNAGGGKLVAAEPNVVLDEDNGMVPVYDGTGYIFTKAGFAINLDEKYEGEGIKINAVAYPVNMEAVELLKDGGADNSIQIMIVLNWDDEQGTGSQQFVFTDEVVASVYSSNNGTWDSYSKMFSMIITGTESVENLSASIMLVSGTTTEYGTTPVSIK